MYIYTSQEPITAHITLTPVEIASFDHLGVELCLIGEILNFDTKCASYFLSKRIELLKEGTLCKPTTFTHAFRGVDFVYESYNGEHFSVMYYIQLKITRKVFNSVKVYNKYFIVQHVQDAPLIVGNCRMEIGMSDKLHMEYELFENKFHLNDVITGRLFFKEVLTMIRNIEIVLLRKEKVRTLTSCDKDDEMMNFDYCVVGISEACDGQPMEGNVIPFRMYLKGRGLSPTVKRGEVFSVNYYVKIQVVLENEKVLYKNQEVVLWRKEYG